MRLNKPFEKDNKKITELKLDFNKITGQVIIDAEKTARMLGDQTPDVSFSMTFQSLIAVKAANEKINYDDLLELNGSDFLAITKEVSNFLFAWALPKIPEKSYAKLP